MTSKPDLGVILAAAGGALALGAVIAGFVIVGGPGDARAERFDDIVAQEMQQTAAAAQCAYWLSGKAPASVTQIEAVIQDKRAEADKLNCLSTTLQDNGSTRVVYSAVDNDHIRLCGDFRRASSRPDKSLDYWWSDQFPELRRARPQAGSHCFDIQLQPAPPLPG